MLTQEEVKHQVAIMKLDPSDPELVEPMGGNVSGLNISEVPEETVPYDCVPTNKCTLGKGSCVKIRDRFLNIQAGIQDMLSMLKTELEELQAGCLKDKTNMESQIAK